MQPKRIAVLASGSGSNLQALIDNQGKLFDGEIVLVFSNRENAYALERARLNDIECLYMPRSQYSSDEEYDEKLAAYLIEKEIDLVVLAGYLRIMTEKIVSSFENRIINIHPSLLPSFGGLGAYGIHVHEMVVNRGCKVSGATVHFVDKEADNGPIILQESLKVNQNWQALDLQEHVLEIEHKILPLAVKYFCEDRLVVRDGRVFIEE